MNSELGLEESLDMSGTDDEIGSNLGDLDEDMSISSEHNYEAEFNKKRQ